MSANIYYQYKPLESERHIRLLEFHHGVGPRWKGWKRQGPLFSLVHVSLDDAPKFEAISYVWGSIMQVEKLPTTHGGVIPITKSVFEAMPFLLDESITGFLWIDQVCINQDDPDEKGHQVALMSDVYRSAARTLIWLGTEDRTTRTAIELLEYLREWGIHSQPGLNWVYDALEDPQGQILVAKSGGNNRAAISIIEKLLSRPWFTRGWVVQEFALSNAPVFVIGRYKLGWNATYTACTAIPLGDVMNRSNFFRLTLLLHAQDVLSAVASKTENESIKALIFCRLLSYSFGLFTTKDHRDRIFAYMGIWLPPGFDIDYRQAVGETYIRFTRHVIDELGLLEIIGAGHALETPRLEDLRGLPSWVPDFSGHTDTKPLIWDVADVRPTAWNASSSRPYQRIPGDSPLEVHAAGKCIDTVTTVTHIICSESSHGPLDAYNELSKIEGGFMSKSEFLRMVSNIQNTGTWYQEFSFEDLFSYCEAYWDHGESTNKENLASASNSKLYEKDRNIEEFLWSAAHDLAWCFTRTIGGSFCLVPRLTASGDAIVILHGCCVPHVLRKTDDPERYKMVGECYIQGAMRGEAVTWAEDEADVFILV